MLVIARVEIRPTCLSSELLLISAETGSILPDVRTMPNLGLGASGELDQVWSEVEPHSGFAEGVARVAVEAFCGGFGSRKPRSQHTVVPLSLLTSAWVAGRSGPTLGVELNRPNTIETAPDLADTCLPIARSRSNAQI